MNPAHLRCCWTIKDYSSADWWAYKTCSEPSTHRQDKSGIPYCERHAREMEKNGATLKPISQPKSKQ